MAISALHCVVCEDRYDIHGDDVEGRTVRCPECGEVLTQDLSDWGGRFKKKNKYKKEVKGQCKLKKQLWAGPESVTYRAEHLDRSMPVWFELWPHDQEGYDEEWIIQLFRGLAEASQLRHPNVVILYDLGRREGYDFCMREIADGGSVRRWIDDRGRVRLSEALPVIEDALRVLKEAERNDLYSGRISPDTFLLDYDDSLKMHHFGRPYHPRELHEFAVTSGRKLTGPCYYVAPEQVEDPNNGSIQSDLYSLGLTLYEMLTGQRAFDGHSAEEILEVRRREQPVAISTLRSDLPEEVCDFIGDLVVRDPDERPDSAAEVLERFRSMAQTINERPGVTDAPTIAEKRHGRHQTVRAVMWTILAFLLIAISIIPFYRMFTEETRGEKLAEKAKEEMLEKGRVLIVGAAATNDEPGNLSRTFATMAALQVDTFEKLGAINPHLIQQKNGEKTGFDRILLETDPTYLLKLDRIDEKWKLSFQPVEGRNWKVEKQLPADTIGGLKSALNALLQGVARDLDVSDPKLVQLPENMAFWNRLGMAQQAEREGDFKRAIRLLDEASESVSAVPHPVPVIRRYCAQALRWEQEQDVKMRGDDLTLPKDELSGEWSAMARVLNALNTEEKKEVRGELAKLLGARPESPRGFYLLGHWRKRAGMPAEECLATFWQGVEAAPGYMPNVYAILHLKAREGADAVQETLSKYREIAWDTTQIERAERYAESLEMQ